MAAGFKVWNLFNNEFLNANPHVAAAVVAGSLMAAGAVAYRLSAPKVSATTQNDRDFVPPQYFGIRNVVELAGEFIQGLARDVIGHHYAKFLPILIFIFLWTLINNLLGLVPTLGASTDNLNTTLAMGLFVFIYYNLMGIVINKGKYIEQYTGHLHGLLLLALGPLMFVIEVFSHMVRPVTLGIRLRSNMYGDHYVFSVISGMFAGMGEWLTANLGAVGQVLQYVVSAIGPVPIMMLGLLICVIQAFVFTLLTTIYIGMATAHDDH